jgi:hypothetical protein
VLTLHCYVAGLPRHPRQADTCVQPGWRGLGAAGSHHHVSAPPAQHYEILTNVQQLLHLHVPAEGHRRAIAVLLSLPGVRSQRCEYEMYFSL